jgi:NAD(P)-dependent dehydrogenase (short-subunit alcohol dehydrogenase family)
VSLESFRQQIETNLFGTIIVTKAAIPLFRERRSGRFIQISSIGGRAGAVGRGPYSAAKFGVEGFSEVLAEEMRPFGVHVTIVEPGGFRTDFAGPSTVINDGHADYAETVGATAARQRAYDGISRAIRRKPRRPSSPSQRLPHRRCGSCSAAMRWSAPPCWTWHAWTSFTGGRSSAARPISRRHRP